MSAERAGGVLAGPGRGFSRYPRERSTRLTHRMAGPAYIAATLATATQALQAQWFGAAVAFVFAAIAFAVQGVGHKRERTAPEPFSGAGDFAARMLAEQFITFPRFVLSGQWARNLAEPATKRLDHG